AMESTVVATAMPTVVRSLGGIQIYSWVFSGFLLTQTVTMPLWGRFSDLYGRRPVFLIGLATFLGGSALSGTAQSMAQLIVFRMVQGLGAGSLMTLGYTIIGELFGLERRAKLQGWISGVWGAAVLSPLGLGLTGLVLFVVVERRAAEPIVPLRLFGSRMVIAAVVTRFLAGMAMFGAISFVPLFLQSVTGTTATGAGMVLTPF